MRTLSRPARICLLPFALVPRRLALAACLALAGCGAEADDPPPAIPAAEVERVPTKATKKPPVACKTVAQCPANPCGTATCQPGVGCVYTASGEGNACNDGQPCTTRDTCVDAVCSGLFWPGETTFASVPGQRPNAIVAQEDALGRLDGWWLAGEATATAGDVDAWVLRVEGDGSVRTSKTWGGPGWQRIEAATAASDGGLLVAGSRAGAGGSDGWLGRVDAKGEVVWQKTQEGSENDGLHAIAWAGEGFVAAGSTQSLGAGKGDGQVVRFAGDGTVTWRVPVGGSLNDALHGVGQLAGGGFAVAGLTWKPSVGEEDVLVARLDANGKVAWTKSYGGIGADIATSLVTTPDGGLFVAGTTSSKGAGKTDVWLLRLDASGNLAWDRAFGGKEHDRAQAVVLLEDGSAALFGSTSSTGSGKADAWLVRAGAGGDLRWHRVYGNEAFDRGLALAPLPGGGFALAGAAESATGAVTAWLVRTDAFGHRSCGTQGKCASLETDTCDDADPCTWDHCDGKAGCTHSPVTVAGQVGWLPMSCP